CIIALFRCSQDELFENCRGLDNVESNGLGKKRACIDGDKNDCSMLDAKILRSTKHLIKVLPRRSMRLISKVQFCAFLCHAIICGIFPLVK
ncbi:hypothetical protein Gotri_026674, partial [Gossypium trilobum]|nr:hypothetical protein [Gossypium trilobum]